VDPEPSPETVTEPAPAPPRWGLGDWFVGLLASYALASLAAGLWFALSGDDEPGLAGQAFSQIGLWTGMVGVVVFASRRKGAGRLADDFGFRIRWSDVGLGVAVALVVQLLVLPAIGFLLQPLLGEPEVSEPVRDMIEDSRGPAYVGLLLSVAVGAPIVEELFFRGLLLRSLQRRFGVALAIALSGVAFGLAHGSTLAVNAVILVMISLTVFGAVLAGLAIRTGRLGAGIVAHAAFNLFTIVYLTLNP
jgi:uncharacterized protein